MVFALNYLIQPARVTWEGEGGPGTLRTAHRIGFENNR